MAQGRRMELWQHTTEVAAMINNVNCTKQKDLKDPWQFNPFCLPPAQAAAPVDWATMRAQFESRKKRRKR